MENNNKIYIIISITIIAIIVYAIIIEVLNNNTSIEHKNADFNEQSTQNIIDNVIAKNEANLNLKYHILENDLPIVYAHFTNENNGRVVCMGSAAMGTMAVVIYNTEDGGKTWNKVTPEDFISVHYDTEFMFINEEIGFMFEPQRRGTDDYPELKISKDGGKTWNKIVLNQTSLIEEKNLIFTGLPKENEGKLEITIYTISKQRIKSYYRFYSTDNGNTWNYKIKLSEELID